MHSTPRIIRQLHVAQSIKVNGMRVCSPQSSTFYFGGIGIFSPLQYQLSLYYTLPAAHTHCSIKQWRRRLSLCEENLGITRTFCRGTLLLSSFAESFCLLCILGQMSYVRTVTGRPVLSIRCYYCGRAVSAVNFGELIVQPCTVFLRKAVCNCCTAVYRYIRPMIRPL